jgi:Ca-activated chloride channel family protein
MALKRTTARLFVTAAIGVVWASYSVLAQEELRFRTGVDLVNVTATVTGRDGRFVSGLQREDFTIYDDDKPQEITHFSNERVPVSLGILLDTSGSMTSDKMAAARAAISRFVVELLGPEDEFFFVEFSDSVRITQSWTTDRRAIIRAASQANAGGGTALYDAIARSLPMAAAGTHQKKAILAISDGNDSSSSVTIAELRQAIRESDVLVYSLGVDAKANAGQPPSRTGRSPAPPAARPPTDPFPLPIPGRGTSRRPPFLPQIFGGSRPLPSSSERVNADALRQITDDTGGRTEIIREFDDLEDATARIADELSRQYSLAYQRPSERDGQWHTIRVEVRQRGVTVRARRGYVAS